MDAAEFARIQRAARLSDRELSRRLGYGPNGVRRIRRFKGGQADIPDSAADAMRAIEAEPPPASR